MVRKTHPTVRVILDSLEICAKTSGNKIVQNALMYARDKISEGKDLASPLQETKVFPAMVVQMIGVGEQTGAMDQMLQKIARIGLEVEQSCGSAQDVEGAVQNGNYYIVQTRPQVGL